MHDVSFAHMDLHDAFGGVHSSPDKHSARVTITDSRISGFHGGGASHGVNVPAGDTGWLIQDTEISGADDSCLIDLGTANRYERLAVHDCGFGTSEQGAHGLYLRGPEHVVSDSHVWNARTSCVTVRFQGDRVLGNDLHDCEVGISFFDYSTKAGEIEMARNKVWDTDIGIYADNTKRIGFKISNNTILGGRADGKAGQGINLAFVRSAALTNNIVTGNADPALRVDHTDDGYAGVAQRPRRRGREAHHLRPEPEALGRGVRRRRRSRARARRPTTRSSSAPTRPTPTSPCRTARR